MGVPLQKLVFAMYVKMWITLVSALLVLVAYIRMRKMNQMMDRKDIHILMKAYIIVMIIRVPVKIIGYNLMPKNTKSMPGHPQL